MSGAIAQPFGDHLFRSLQINDLHRLRIDDNLVAIRLLERGTRNDSIATFRQHLLDQLPNRIQPRRTIGVVERDPAMHLPLAASE